MKILPLFCSLWLLAASETLHSGSATWKLDPTSSDWNTAANWTPETVPSDAADIATFKSSNTTAVFLSARIRVNSAVFDPYASSFIISTGAHPLTFLGPGIVNNSHREQNFITGLVDGGTIRFRNNASAGDAVFTVHGDALQPYVSFYDHARAGDATFINHGGFGGAVTWFFDASTAGNATFYNFTGGDGFNDGVTVFEDWSTAGTATILCEGGGAVFHKHSNAANSALTANAGNIVFLERATAGDATIIANGADSPGQLPANIFFLSDQASAGNATLIANGGSNGGEGARIVFWYQTRGDEARVELFGNGKLDISAHNPLAPMTIGSLEGTGAVLLGANNLTVGRNDLNTIFAGIIQDGENGGTGGSLTKAGAGTLSLEKDSSYTGGTIVESGSLLVDNTEGSGTGTGSVEVVGGKLGGNGIISGAVMIGSGEAKIDVTGSVGRGILEPGIDTIGVLTIENALTFRPRGTCRCKIDATEVNSDKIAAAEVTISDGALFSPMFLGNAALPPGTVFTVIDNTGVLPISGTFSNLSDGSTFTVGNNTFQATYEGGDGNDLTFTVVP